MLAISFDRTWLGFTDSVPLKCNKSSQLLDFLASEVGIYI